MPMQQSFVFFLLRVSLHGSTLQTLNVCGLPRITGRVDSVAAAAREWLQVLGLSSKQRGWHLSIYQKVFLVAPVCDTIL